VIVSLDRCRPLIYVPGNHDYCSHFDNNRPELRTTWEQQRMLMPEVAKELGIIFLDDSSVETDNVLFIGATLWTDMSARPGLHDERRGRAPPPAVPATSWRRARPSTPTRHRLDSSKALADRLDGMDAVVVTHMAPSHRSLFGWDPEHPERTRDLDWCYASNCEALMVGDKAPQLRLHWHIHAGRDYQIGNTRIVANPRGYPGPRGTRENPDFDPALVVELDPALTFGMRMG
jgi:hypothetical protein